MAITWADDVLNICSCEIKGDWNGFGQLGNPDDNTSASQNPIYIEGSACMESSIPKQKG